MYACEFVAVSAGVERRQNAVKSDEYARRGSNQTRPELDVLCILEISGLV